MNHLSFPASLCFALAASLLGAIAAALLVPIFGKLHVLQVSISATSLAYLVLLIARTRGRAGRPSALLIWGLGVGAAWLAGLSLAPFLLVHAAVISLVRGALGCRRVIAWVLDLAIAGAAVAATLVTLAHTASVGLGLWVFYLAQALTACAAPPRPSAEPDHDDARFERAHRSAQTAVRQLLAR